MSFTSFDDYKYETGISCVSGNISNLLTFNMLNIIQTFNRINGKGIQWTKMYRLRNLEALQGTQENVSCVIVVKAHCVKRLI